MLLTHTKRRRKNCLAPLGTKQRARTNMGRRFEKKVEVNGETSLHEGYIYHGYLQTPFQAAKRYIIWECCVNGKWYKKQGKYCISFGMIGEGYLGFSCGASEDGGSSDSDSSGDSSISGDEQARQPRPPIPFPPGIDGPDTNGDRGVYRDMDDPATEEAYRAKTSCCQEDKAIMEYFNGLYGQRANYALWGQNCRDFSKAVFDYCKNNFSDKCK